MKCLKSIITIAGVSFLATIVAASLVPSNYKKSTAFKYETSIGIINQASDISHSKKYQIAGIKAELLEEMTKDEIDNFMTCCQYCFISVSDSSWVESFAKERKFRIYDLNADNPLIGVILDETDDPVLIPVHVVFATKKSPWHSKLPDSEKTSVELINTDLDESMLLKIYSVIRIADMAYSDTRMYFDNCRNTEASPIETELQQIAESYTIVAKLQANNNLFSNSIIAIAHNSLTEEKTKKEHFYDVIANTEIVPCRNVRIKRYSSKLEVLDGDTMGIESKRCAVESFKNPKKSFRAIMNQKGNKNISVPYQWTWANQYFTDTFDKSTCTWSSKPVDEQKNMAYCMSTENGITVHDSKRAWSIEKGLVLSLDTIELKTSILESWLWEKKKQW